MRSSVSRSGQCPWQNDTLPTVANGYRKTVDNLKLYSDGLAYGFYDIDCNGGFRLDANIGGRITCLDSGLWSQPLPSCICESVLSSVVFLTVILLSALGSCVISDLFTFIETSQGIRSDPAKSFVFTNGVDDTRALGGSNVTLDCQTDFVNVGGALTIVCTENNTWTTFPQCVSTATATTPTADAVDASVRCPVNNDTWIFAHGYMSNTSGLFLYSDNTAKGQPTLIPLSLSHSLAHPHWTQVKPSSRAQQATPWTPSVKVSSLVKTERGHHDRSAQVSHYSTSSLIPFSV